MSPTYLSLQIAAAEKRAEKARQAGEISEMQRELAEMTRLNNAFYRAPLHPSLGYTVRSSRT